MKKFSFIAILLITCFFTKLYASETNAIHGEIISYETTEAEIFLCVVDKEK